MRSHSCGKLQETLLKLTKLFQPHFAMCYTKPFLQKDSMQALVMHVGFSKKSALSSTEVRPFLKGCDPNYHSKWINSTGIQVFEGKDQVKAQTIPFTLW